MNTLRITKGRDIKLFANDEQLFFVTEFFAKEDLKHYEIKEFLSNDEVESVISDRKYILVIKALSLMNPKAFYNDDFTITACDNENVYEYSNCHLESKKREVLKDKPVHDTYTIVSSKLRIKEVCYE